MMRRARNRDTMLGAQTRLPRRGRSAGARCASSAVPGDTQRWPAQTPRHVPRTSCRMMCAPFSSSFGDFLVGKGHQTSCSMARIDMQDAICIKCGKKGHNERACPFEICFNCGQAGHQSRVCFPPVFGPRGRGCFVLGDVLLIMLRLCSATYSGVYHQAAAMGAVQPLQC
jgi:hypothetical protein